MGGLHESPVSPWSIKLANIAISNFHNFNDSYIFGMHLYFTHHFCCSCYISWWDWKREIDRQGDSRKSSSSLSLFLSLLFVLRVQLQQKCCVKSFRIIASSAYSKPVSFGPSSLGQRSVSTTGGSQKEELSSTHKVPPTFVEPKLTPGDLTSTQWVGITYTIYKLSKNYSCIYLQTIFMIYKLSTIYSISDHAFCVRFSCGSDMDCIPMVGRWWNSGGCAHPTKTSTTSVACFTSLHPHQYKCEQYPTCWRKSPSCPLPQSNICDLILRFTPV